MVGRYVGPPGYPPLAAAFSAGLAAPLFHAAGNVLDFPFNRLVRAGRFVLAVHPAAGITAPAAVGIAGDVDDIYQHVFVVNVEQRVPVAIGPQGALDCVLLVGRPSPGTSGSDQNDGKVVTFSCVRLHGAPPSLVGWIHFSNSPPRRGTSPTRVQLI